MLSCYLRLFGLFLILFFTSSNLTLTAAYGSNSDGNITVKWDLLNWTPDGYVAVVTISNFQKHRSIQSPGWRLGWTWARNEVIWATIGGQATNQGDCSRFKGNVPVSCVKSPTIMDLKPSAPYNQQIEDCCHGGVLAPWSKQTQAKARSAFQITVGLAGNTNRTVKMPKYFTFKAPGGGYSCGPAKIIRPPTRFLTADRRRVTQALMTWNVTCSYSN